MSTLNVDPLNSWCPVCARKITVVDTWVPFQKGIRHAACRPEFDEDDE